jgi:predicted nucleotide-binding protein
MTIEELRNKQQELIISLLKLENNSSNLVAEIDELIEEIKSTFSHSEKLDEIFINLQNLKKTSNISKFKILQSKIESSILMQTFNVTHELSMSLIESVESIKLKNLNFTEVFIVHGHDEEMKIIAEEFILSLGLKPIIFHKAPNHSRTIIQKLNDLSDVNFVIILLSGDDYGFSRCTSNHNAKLRARQNVIFEMGYFLGKIGQNRTFTLFKSSKNFEFPSDLASILYEPLDEKGDWKIKLIEELKLIGYSPKE